MNAIQQDNSKLEWEVDPQLDLSWDTSKVDFWITKCGRYRVARIESTLTSSKEQIKFGVEQKVNWRERQVGWDLIEHTKDGVTYPKYYKSLQAAIEAVEEFHYRETGEEAISNAATVVAKAKELGLGSILQTKEPESYNGVVMDESRTVDKIEPNLPNPITTPAPNNYSVHESGEENVAKKKETTGELGSPFSKFEVNAVAARLMFTNMGYPTDKWSTKTLTAKLEDLPSLASAAEFEPTGDDKALFNSITEAIQRGDSIAVVGEKPLKKEKTAKASKKSRPSKNGEASKNHKPKTERKKREGMSGLDAAAKILGEVKMALSPKEIVEKASAKGYWTSGEGKTPWDTIKAAMLTEIKKKGKESRFVKPEPGQFALAGVKLKRLTGPTGSELCGEGNTE